MFKISHSSKIFSILILITTWPMTLLIGVVIGYTLNLPFTPDTLSSWVTAIATVAITILTFFLAKETWELRIIQTNQIKELQLEGIRPSLNIALESSTASIQLFDVKISNFGKGVARNIKFRLQGKNEGIPNKEAEILIDTLNKLGPLRNGITSLGINQTIKSFAFNFIELHQNTNDRAFSAYVRIQANFEDTLGTEYETEFVLDLSQYEGISRVGTPPEQDIANHLKDIKDSLQRIAHRHQGRLDVNVCNKADRIEEDENKRMRERRRSEQQRKAVD